MNAAEIVKGVFSADARAIARAISKVENAEAESSEIMRAVFERSGNAMVIGITGSPGAGKSSLVDKLAMLYKEKGEKIGIIAVDPSSPFSGGAILGDRIRMSALGTDKNIFIRSMATRGNLGGLARATVDAVNILDAAGFQKVIVETVGVGQDEVEIVKAADVVVVVLVPGMGDDVQAIKAGIMEIGDLFVINKADRDGVLKTERELKMLLELTSRQDGWNPPIIKTIAVESKGIDELAEAISKYYEFQKKNENLQRRSAVAKWRLLELLREKLLQELLNKNGAKEKLDQLALEVAQKRIDPYSAVEKILR
ncbi:MAG: methylmalonyl Co-A mutase-associated GTPase MeaB [Pyrinomonadaceae bacterium]|nr:methylmalonyl Co-A mutase-associated GTPase MeaB [Pyrinomonadaceae bacterium]MCX7640888.1 methylmalonyl Co-A mutase-associated GTPase MeaB [Pyrinomonadaceae bacterium]MDW8304279.1 methylmalonyl Co-A mutase-associated GTPase MeaB [Acidobacteriota bacterium]